MGLKEANHQLRQFEFKRKAEELVIQIVYGPGTGRPDVNKTAELQKILVKVNGEVDWEQTYKLRRIAQEGHYRDEEKKRDSR